MSSSFQPGAMLYTQGFGSRAENVEVPFLTNRNPSSTDVNFPIGKRWINTILNAEFCLTSFVSSAGRVTANWQASTTAGTGTAGVATLLNGTVTVLTPDVQTGTFITLTRQSIGATGAAALGQLTVGTITNGVSFTIHAVQPANATALQATDESIIYWELTN